MSTVSQVTESFGLKSLNTGTAPLYIATPTTDQLFMPTQRARTIEILNNNDQKFNMQIFSGVSHGFAVSSTPLMASNSRTDSHSRREVIPMIPLLNGQRKRCSIASSSGLTFGCPRRARVYRRSAARQAAQAAIVTPELVKRLWAGNHSQSEE